MSELHEDSLQSFMQSVSFTLVRVYHGEILSFQYWQRLHGAGLFHIFYHCHHPWCGKWNHLQGGIPISTKQVFKFKKTWGIQKSDQLNSHWPLITGRSSKVFLPGIGLSCTGSLSCCLCLLCSDRQSGRGRRCREKGSNGFGKLHHRVRETGYKPWRN